MTPFPETLILPSGHFNLNAWRRILSLCAQEVSSRFQTLAPFGFEVSRNPQYLKRNLNNLYVYLGTDPEFFEEEMFLVEKFKDHLTSKLYHYFPDFYLSLFQVIAPSGRTYFSKEGRRTIHIKYRPCSSNLLSDYAHYLIASIGGVNERKIKAVLEFKRDPLSQRYLFQLCIIINYVFSQTNLFLSKEQIVRLQEQVKRLHTAEVQGLSRAATTPTDEQRALLHEVALPYFANLGTVIQQVQEENDSIALVRMLDFHGRNVLSTPILERLFHDRTQFIIDSYNSFPELAICQE